MSFDDWILSLHVLSGTAMIGATVLFTVLVLYTRKTDDPETTVKLGPTVMLGNLVVIPGSLATIVFGVWLAFSVGNYDIWDGWIIAAIVLWAISVEAGRRAGLEFERGMKKAQELVAAGQTGPNAELGALNRTQNGIVMHAISTTAVLLVLIDMIWKPGA